MKLALKVDVNTYRGTLEGVPRLVQILRRFGAGATFFFCLGPDHAGRAIARIFQPGFLKHAARTSALSHYGIRTLLYGTLLPAPDVGRRCADILRGVRDSGYEVGIHCWDHVRWQRRVEHADADWTAGEMRRACARHQQVFGEPARAHGAAGWQMNVHALRLTQRLGMHYSSDCRGQRPFVPVWNGEIVGCPQIPTTLPTLDELIGHDGVTAESAPERLLALTRDAPAAGHVYTLRAELEGMKLAPALERILAGWRDQGYAFTALGDILPGTDLIGLPRHEMLRGEVAGRPGTLMVQGPAFLADA